MVLSKEEKGEIAWRYLVLRARQMRIDQISVEKTRDHLKTILASAMQKHAQIVGGSVHEFSCDFVDAVYESMRHTKTVAKVDYHLSDSRRFEVAYVFCLYAIKEEGIRIGKSTKREINARAKELGVKSDVAQAFFKIVVRDILEIALH